MIRLLQGNKNATLQCKLYMYTVYYMNFEVKRTQTPQSNFLRANYWRQNQKINDQMETAQSLPDCSPSKVKHSPFWWAGSPASILNEPTAFVTVSHDFYWHSHLWGRIVGLPCLGTGISRHIHKDPVASGWNPSFRSPQGLLWSSWRGFSKPLRWNHRRHDVLGCRSGVGNCDLPIGRTGRNGNWKIQIASSCPDG